MKLRDLKTESTGRSTSSRIEGIRQEIKAQNILIFGTIIILVFILWFMSSSFGVINHNLAIVSDDVDTKFDLIRGSLQCNTTSAIKIDTAGHYSYPSDTIKLYIKKADLNKTYQNFIHEWGHHVWYEELNRFERDSYCNLDFKKNVTEYASTKCEENFAETYMYWSLDREIPEPQLSWMEDVLDEPEEHD